jgi:hypothetical protein
MHHLHDIVLDLVSSQSMGAWLLYEDGQGCRHIHCLPLAFSEGAAGTGERHVVPPAERTC